MNSRRVEISNLRLKAFFFHRCLLQRDENGDFLTTVGAIDAKQFKYVSREAQYEESAVLRELNKALVGFYNPEVGSKVIPSHSGQSLCGFKSKIDALSGPLFSALDESAPQSRVEILVLVPCWDTASDLKIRIVQQSDPVINLTK